MSDDVEASFAAVRVSYQQGHIPCRSARFTSSCARVTKSTDFEKNPPCQPTPPNKCGRAIHCERPSTCRWHVSQVVARSSCQSRFANFHESSGYGTQSKCRFARFTSGSIARDRPAPRTFRYVLPENKRLPCVVRARSAWRCATPCCLSALPSQRGNAFTVIFTSSEDPRGRSVALVPWPWAETVRTYALPRFD